VLQQCSFWLEILWSSSLHSSEFLVPCVALLSLIFKNKLCCSQSGNPHKQLEVSGLYMGGEQGVRKELGRETGKLLCEGFPLAPNLYWRSSSKRQFVWVSAGWSVQSYAEVRSTSVRCLKLDTISGSFAIEYI